MARNSRLFLVAGLSLWAASASAAAGDGGEHGSDAVLPLPTLASPGPVQLTSYGRQPRIERPGRQAPQDAPNIVIVMLDDVGFGASKTFGGPVPTPSLNELAEGGLRFNRFHTTGMCSPTRAALLTGRNSHAVGVGKVLNTVNGNEGRQGILTDRAATIAEILHQNGYSTSAWGKWHLTPAWERSPAGPFDRWPTHKGFDKFYGFLGAEMEQFHPTLHDGTALVEPPKKKNYTLTRDLADHAIAWMHLQKSTAPNKPFFVYFATGATHAPLQVPKRWIKPFEGKFDQGWDRIRETIIKRQKKLGVIPAHTKLTARPNKIPSWQSLSADQKTVAARLMATYAGYLEQTDAQVGRLVKTLKDMGEFDNTLFFYIVGDNGGAPGGGPLGSLNTNGSFQGIRMPAKQAVKRLDAIGGPDTHAGYPVGWAWAMDTPFKWTKYVASYLGATRNPLVVSWPDRIKRAGGLRSQFSDVDDIFPTILDAVGIHAPAEVNGVPQKPLNGTSLLYAFNDPHAKGRHHTQYFDIMGNRAIYHDGWMASAFHRIAPWNHINPPTLKFENDSWELYNLDQDFSQAEDLAAKKPQKLAQLKNQFWVVAARNNVLPLNVSQSPRLPDRLAGAQGAYDYHEGAVGLPQAVSPPIFNRSYTITADIDVAKTNNHGVIASQGSETGGWSLYIDHAGRPVYLYNLFNMQKIKIVGKKPLASGATTVKAVFDYDGGGWGRGATLKLWVDDEQVGQGRLTRTPLGIFSLSDTFDVGTDIGSAVGDYAPYDRFTGDIRNVRIALQKRPRPSDGVAQKTGHASGG